MSGLVQDNKAINQGSFGNGTINPSLAVGSGNNRELYLYSLVNPSSGRTS